jgi:hypothetical protein
MLHGARPAQGITAGRVHGPPVRVPVLFNKSRYQPQVIMRQPNSGSSDAADAFLAGVLRGESGVAIPADVAAMVPARALHHGVTALITARQVVMDSLPRSAHDLMRTQALGEAMWDLRHRQVLIPLLDAMERAGVPVVLLKGTALAYSRYPSPALRARGDTDVLIPPAQRENARLVLAACGFGLASNRDADRTTQEEWVSHATDGSAHAIDLHWNLMWAWALSQLFDTDHLVGRARPCPALCASARILPPGIALLHACLHRASHFNTAYFVGGEAQFGGDRLIWFYDMHLLAQAMTDQDWKEFAEITAASGSEAICRNAFDRCIALFHSPIPVDIMERLAAAPARSIVQDFFVTQSFPRRVIADLRALPRGQSRMAFLKEIFLPSEKVMRAAYPGLAHYSLPRLHLYRYLDRLRRLLLKRRQSRRPS